MLFLKSAVFVLLTVSLQSTPSLKSVFLAGRVASSSKPDGIGSGAFLDFPNKLTGCNGKLYFYDKSGLRAADAASGAVVTLSGPGDVPPFITCDGAHLYSTYTPSGALTVRQYDIATGQTSTYSYPQTGSFNIGPYNTSEYSLAADGVLYTADSAAGRVWKIDPVTRSRTVVIDYGGPVIMQVGGSLGPRFPAAVLLGPLWVDGTNLYLIRYDTIERIDMNSGTATRLRALPGRFLWGESQFLYFLDVYTLRMMNVISGQTLTIRDGVDATALWADARFIYFGEQAELNRIDKTTGQMITLAGEKAQAIDGDATSARFADPHSLISITGDSKSLYIKDSGYLRVFDKSTGRVSTLPGVGPFYGGMWSDGKILIFSEYSCIRKIDLSTREVTTIAGLCGGTLGQFADGVGSEAKFATAQGLWSDGHDVYVVDDFAALRKVELATGRVTTLRGRTYSPGGFNSIGAMWGIGRRLYFLADGALWSMNLDNGVFSKLAVTDWLRFDDRLWGDDKYLFLLDKNQTIERIDPVSGAASTIYASADLIQGIYGDTSGLYVVEGFALRRLEPDDMTRVFGTQANGLNVFDVGPQPSATVLQSEVHVGPQRPPASATAIWSYRNPQGVLISEASVSGQTPIAAGRIYAEVNGPLNTGIALSNPNDADVRVDFYFTDTEGVDSGNGSLTLAPHSEVARFLNETPFESGDNFQGTFSFSASRPIVAIALRGLTNERSEFLMTTLPVADLNATARHDALTLAQYASGSGWTTQVLLVNPTNDSASGTIRFFDDAGNERDRKSYAIAPRSSNRIVLDNDRSDALTGSASVQSDGVSATAVPLVVFSYAIAGTTVTETGVTSAEGNPLSSYIEMGDASIPDSVNSGIAIANPNDQTVSVLLRPTSPLNDLAIDAVLLRIPPHGHISKFVSELFPALPRPFIGTLHPAATIEGAGGTPSISVTGLRGRYNSRNEFIVTTVTPAVDRALPVTEIYLPHLVTGGGYTTRIFLVNTYSWTAGTISFRTAAGVPVPPPQ